MKKIFFWTSIFLFPIFYFLFPHSLARAAVCGETIPTDEGSLKTYVEDCNAKLSQLSGQKQTLAQALAVLNTQIQLTTAKIAAKTAEINRLEIEITDLSGKIESLDYSLDDLTRLFMARVRESYMYHVPFPALFVAQTSGLSGVARGSEYLQKVRDHDRTLLLALEKSRLDFDQEKTAKETKQAEIEQLKSVLDREKAALAGQVAAKNKLLAETKNDEARYQQLRASAQAQLDAFTTYVSRQGGASVLSGTTQADSGWGTYYNQREDDWALRLLPGSNYTLASSGCLITSMAMVMSYYGKSVTPGNIADQPELFSFGDFRQGSWSIAGVGTTRTRIGYSRSALDDELASNPGKPVIVGIIQYGSSRPEHFFVVKAKDGDDYLINDPFPENGHNLKFTSRYPLRSIAAVDRVTVN